MSIPRIPIENFNLGGLADSEYMGVKYSLSSLIGLDLHSEPGLMKVHQKLTKSSGATVDEFVKAMIITSDGNIYAFSADSGKVWKCTTSFSWSLAHTTTPAAGGAGCSGACEFNGYIYWATESRLHRIAIGDTGDWSANADEDWATFSNADDTYHPMVELNGDLYIGDGYYVALVDGSGTYTADSLDLIQPHRVKCLGKRKDSLLIGTYISDDVNVGGLFVWNTYSPSWSDADFVQERGINAFIPFDNDVVVSAGVNGNLYYWDGSVLRLYKTIPGTYTNSDYLEIHPNSVANHLGIPLIGVSKGAGDPLDMMVYSFGHKNAAYPAILAQPYPISQRSGSDFVLANIEIGAICAFGNNLLVSWKDTNSGTVYGVDKLDWSNKLDGAYFESRLMQPDRDTLSVFSKYLVNYKSRPSGTSIGFSYDKNHTESYTSMSSETVNDSDRKQEYAELALEAHSLKLKVALTASGNDAPEIESMAVYMQPQ